MTQIFYHRDLDGLVSAAVALIKWPGAITTPIQHGDDIVSKLQADQVVLVDYTPPKAQFEALLQHAKVLCWIDHHDSSFGHGPSDLPGVRKVDSAKAACWMVWEWVTGITTTCPQLIVDVSYYDVGFKNDSWNTQTLPIARGMCLEDPSPERLRKNLSSTSFYQRVLQTGTPIVQYANMQNEWTANRYSWETTVQGYDALAINFIGESYVLDSILDEHDVDLIVLYRHMPNGKWGFSFFAGTRPDTEADCGEIARSLGGGGRKTAAGAFNIETLEEVLGT